MKSLIYVLSIGILLTACSSKPGAEDNNSTKEANMTDLKTIAMKAQDAFFKDYSEEGVKKYFKAGYIQHNPHVPTGIEPVIGFLPVLKEAGTTYKTHRLLQDGDFIVFHNTYYNAEAFGANEVVTFDIWRMEDGMVAEHWDCITPRVTETASGRSQTDGPTEIKDLDLTEANKALIKAFAEDVLIGGDGSRMTDYISTEQYDQHNPMVKDGLAGVREAFEYLASQNQMFTYHKVHRVLGEGNFVLTQSEGEWKGKKTAFYDLFRLENGKIVEHWDVIQEIPEEMAHTNGMF